jgi:hypothetical protein
MSARAARWLAWGAWLVTLAANGSDIWLNTFNPQGDALPVSLFGGLVYLAFATAGALVVSRRPRNAIGWLLLGAAFCQLAGSISINYAVYGLIVHPGNPGAAPGAQWLAPIGGELRAIGFYVIVTYLLLLFPIGRLPSPRWRWFAWATALVEVVASLSQLLSGDLSAIDTQLTGARNPLGVIPQSIADPIQTIFGFGLFFLCVIGCVASVIVRYRRAGVVERQQIKWLAVAGIWVALAFLAVIVGAFTNNSALASAMSFYVGMIGIPIAVGVAILRYRLFDIDVIINRALVYGLLTALLAGIYFGCVLGAQGAIRLVTRSAGPEPSVVIVGSTLLIAALFQPLRRRIQRSIDRRFYRHSYDAALTVARFSETLRTDVDLTTLMDHLTSVVDETMRPAHVSLWLQRDEQGQRRG